MQNRVSSYVREAGFPSLLGVSIAGVLVYFPLSRGTVLADVSEIALPLGIVAGFLVSASLIRFHEDRERLEKRFAQYGWMGAFVGGIIGAWLAVLQLSQGSPIGQAFDEVLTVLDIGIGAGAFVGMVIATTRPSPPRREDRREHVLAESTWTNRPGPNPIAVEIVEQIADLQEVDPLDMEPLSAHIDLDVFRDIRAGDGSHWQVLFHTDEYEIRVSSHGTVTVYDGQRTGEGPEMASSVRSIRRPK